jgi:hypothetical protein
MGTAGAEILQRRVNGGHLVFRLIIGEAAANSS